MDFNTIETVLPPRGRADRPDRADGDAFLAGGTWLVPVLRPGACRLVDLAGSRRVPAHGRRAWSDARSDLHGSDLHDRATRPARTAGRPDRPASRRAKLPGTHTVAAWACRGYGRSQTIFALASALDPFALRRRNAVRTRDARVASRLKPHDVVGSYGLDQCLTPAEFGTGTVHRQGAAAALPVAPACVRIVHAACL
jgi:hypothetical protein